MIDIKKNIKRSKHEIIMSDHNKNIKSNNINHPKKILNKLKISSKRNDIVTITTQLISNKDKISFDKVLSESKTYFSVTP